MWGNTDKEEGSSSHNSCIAFWPPDEDLRLWEAAGAAGLGPEALRPFIDRVRRKVSLEFPPPGRHVQNGGAG